MLLILVSIGLVLLVLYFIYVYNHLISLNNLTQEAWSGIDIQLKRRADLIPNLLETVKGYMQHERGLLEEIAELRAQSISSGSIDERAKNENLLTGALRQLFAVAENYPELKASENFLSLQSALAEIEDQIQLARRYYNGTVRNFNTWMQIFPNNLIAQRLQYSPKPFFELQDVAQREVPSVKF